MSQTAVPAAGQPGKGGQSSKTLVLGLGNSILSDDGVGIHIVRLAAERWRGNGADFAEASVGGLRLLDHLAGYERAILVDAILTPGGRPGSIYHLQPGSLRGSLHSGSSHDLQLPDALALGRGLGWVLPGDEQLTIIAVEAEDVVTFGEICTPAVAEAIPQAVQAVLHELRACI